MGPETEDSGGIAVVGWGSLIWDPRELPVRSSWRPDGPELPIEFARISADGRLTLVIREGAAPIRTLWALMDDRELGAARAHLAQRERTSVDLIGSFDRRTEAGEIDDERAGLATWLRDHQLHAVVWTALPSNFEDVVKLPLSVDAAVKHLGQLSDERRRVAEQYVRRAPAQVRTHVRAGLERVLGWTPTTS